MPASLIINVRQSLKPLLTMLCISVASAAALGFAFILQYGFGAQPCILCLWQRVPFALVILISLIAWLWKPMRKQTPYLIKFCSLIFFCGAALALYHSGVERHWWPGTSSCAAPILTATSVDALRQQLLQTPVARCDQIAWSLFGLSMANWNVVYSLFLGMFSAFTTQRSVFSMGSKI